MPEPGTTAAEQAALKQEFDELRQRVNALESRHQGVLAGLSQATGLSRRQLLAIAGAAGGAGAIGYGATEPVQGAAQDSGGEGDVGSESNPFEGFVDGLAMVTQSVSTSTTIDKPVVLADSALGSLTLTIDAALEGPSGFSQQIVVIDQTGNAGTNSITVENSSNVTVATIDSDNAELVIRWDSGEWITKRFIPTVDAGTVTADKLNNADFTTASDGEVLTKTATGDEVAFEASGGALTDDGTDTDAGDDYALPKAADNIDLQSDGEILNAEAVTTDSLDYKIEDGTDISGSRSLDAIFQNTTGHLIYVYVRADYTLSTSTTVEIDAWTKSNNTSVVSGPNQVDGVTLTTDSNYEAFLSFVVPNGHYYYVREQRGTVDSLTWMEREATAP